MAQKFSDPKKMFEAMDKDGGGSLGTHTYTHTHTHTHTHICLLFFFTIIYKSMPMLACLGSFISDPLTRPRPLPSRSLSRPERVSDGLVCSRNLATSEGIAGPEYLQDTCTVDIHNRALTSVKLSGSPGYFGPGWRRGHRFRGVRKFLERV
jgi:hypothetical protein